MNSDALPHTGSGAAPTSPGEVHALPEVMSPSGLSAYLAVPVATIYRWNCQKSGPPVHRAGRHVRYFRREVDTWLAGR